MELVLVPNPPTFLSRCQSSAPLPVKLGRALSWAEGQPEVETPPQPPAQAGGLGHKCPGKGQSRPNLYFPLQETADQAGSSKEAFSLPHLSSTQHIVNIARQKFTLKSRLTWGLG